MSDNNDTWQVKTNIYLTVINHLNIASIKQLHEKAVHWKIQVLKIWLVGKLRGRILEQGYICF